MWDPVCGVDGQTYGNACEAECVGVDIGHLNACTTGCYTHADCAVGQRCTADDECLLPPDCEDPSLCGDCYGRCVDDGCACPATETPVCGSDGITYRNECEARCTGVAIVDKGACSLCEALTCDLECPIGYATDTNGCPTCACAESPLYCDDLGQCPEGSLCDRRVCDTCDPVCIDASSCDCPGGQSKPACGADGITYDSMCLAACVGVEVVSRGACDSGCQPLDRCGLECPYGYASQPNGCLLCECNPSPQLCKRDVDCPGGMQCDPNACVPSCPTCEDCNPACVNLSTCNCPLTVDPVCGKDGKVYNNLCLAQCAGIYVDDSGASCEANSACLCDLEEEPVCGADGSTYPNACKARCAGVDVVYFGACACKRDCLLADPVCGANGVTYICGADEAACNGVKVRWSGTCSEPRLCDRNADCGDTDVCDAEACAPSCPDCDDCNSACRPVAR